MTRLLYIHGIGDHTEAEHSLWDASLGISVFSRSAPLTVYAWYSDLLHEEHQTFVCDPVVVQPLEEELIRRAEAKIARSINSYQNVWYDCLLSKATRAFTKRFVQDVYRYFFSPETRRKILDRVGSFLHPGDIIVSHSLGTVVAYELLSETNIKTPLMVTIGSPLGLEFVKAELRRIHKQDTLTIPLNVARWHNFADPLDIVAADTTLQDEFGLSIHDHIVVNRDRLRTDRYGPHSIAGYLKAPEIRKVLDL